MPEEPPIKEPTRPSANPRQSSPTYYDATVLLIKRLTQTSKIKDNALMINRAALATATRDTKNHCGATGNVAIDPSGFRTNDPRSC